MDAALQVVGNGVTADSLESETLDFKLVADSPKTTYTLLADALVCFVNAGGGTVVLGVDDKATTRASALRGVPATYGLDQIRKEIFDRTRPPITPFVTEKIVDDVRLIAVSVPQGVLPHCNGAGLATRRLGKECLPFPPDQQREVMIARGQVDWSAEPSGAQVSDLSPVEMGRLRRLLATSGRDHLVELDDLALMGALRLLTPDGAVTNAGVVLLGDEAVLRKKVPGYGYSYQFRPTSGSEATGRLRGTRPLLAAIETVADAVAARQEIHPLNIAGGVQLQLTDYPHDAVRELIVNAFIHRSYETTGTVDIEHAPERLIITSPGGLVAGVTPQNILTHPSTPRNRLLTETISILQLAERTGQGIDRAYREMLRIGKEPPTFEDTGTMVRAALPGGIGNDAFVRFINELPVRAARDVNVLLALSRLRSSNSIDAIHLGTLIQRPAPEAQEVLSAMSEEYHLIEPTRRTASKPFPSYRLLSATVAAMSRAITYARRDIDEIDQKVIDHVNEYGYVTNRTLQRLFDIHMYAARDLLDKLKKRQVLVKLSDARGGIGIRYGLGPHFPKNTRRTGGDAT
ncbi:transcriptional regulator [Acrocarpospora corrugata]|uniref:Transcriptional regulator n=1 Tax=Acrocarpospora corrugata TaxID=35763 RepID=A0A5M3W2K2_9ACTN|nr:transcriptional regulator [Acrocarpospora corrugata]